MAPPWIGRDFSRWLVWTLALVWWIPFGAQSLCADPYDDLQKQANETIRAFDENRFKDALKHLQKLTALLEKYEPTERDAIREAYLWINKNEAVAARKAIDQALALNPKASEALYLRGLVNLRLGNDLAGKQDIRQALTAKAENEIPDSKLWRFMAAKDLWERYAGNGAKEFGLAVTEFQDLALKDPTNSQYLFYLGYAQFALNSFDQAAESFLKGLELKPNDGELHGFCVQALKKSPGLKGAIKRYEQFHQKHAEPIVKLWLAVLLLEDEQKAKAVPYLLELRHLKLDLSARYQLAETLAKAEQHQDAAAQWDRLLKEFFSVMNKEARVNATIGCGKELVKAGKLDEGIHKLNEALTLHRTYFKESQQPLDILFELGDAHWKGKRKEEAELYFREYLRELEKSTSIQQRTPDDVKIAENLGDLYQKDQQYVKAADTYQFAFKTYKVMREEFQAKYPGQRLAFKVVQALHDAQAWDKLIPEAKELVEDKDQGPKVRQLLARAYLENRQAEPALKQLGLLKGTKDWNEESMKLMGQALLLDNRPDQALTYIEEAFAKRKDDDQVALLYAQILKSKDRVEEARDLYKQVLARNPRALKAWTGLADLEMKLAKGAQGPARATHLGQAVHYYEEAHNLDRSDAEIQNQLSQAKTEVALSEADRQARAESVRLVLFTGGLILAALVPIGLFWLFFRRQWALRCFREVCDLERDLTLLIRDRVHTRWAGEWSRLGEEPIRGRLDYKALRNRADKEGAKDVLGVANFGHLVAIIDTGWEALGFNELCAPELADPKEVIVANLSYVSSCRVCLAHFGKLEELTAQRIGPQQGKNSALKAHLSKHLHSQVRASLRIIRAKFTIKLEPTDLPVLAPISHGSIVPRLAPPSQGRPAS